MLGTIGNLVEVESVLPSSRRAAAVICILVWIGQGQGQVFEDRWRPSLLGSTSRLSRACSDLLPPDRRKALEAGVAEEEHQLKRLQQKTNRGH